MFQISELWTIFWKSAPKFRSNWEFLLSKRVIKVRLLEQKQLNIDTNILHQVGLEFDVNSKNRSLVQKSGLLLKFGTNKVNANIYLQDSYLVFFYKIKVKQVTRILKIH